MDPLQWMGDVRMRVQQLCVYKKKNPSFGVLTLNVIIYGQNTSP